MPGTAPSSSPSLTKPGSCSRAMRCRRTPASPPRGSRQPRLETGSMGGEARPIVWAQAQEPGRSGQLEVVEVPEGARVPEHRYGGDKRAANHRQGPARQPPPRGLDEHYLGEEGAVDEAAGDRMDSHPGIDAGLYPVGEDAVVSDWDRQQDRHGPGRPVHGPDLRRRDPD